MNDRKLPALIATLAVLFVCSVLWNAFSPTRAHRHLAANQAPDPAAPGAEVQAAPAVLADSVRPVTKVSQPAALPASGVSYMEQLARAETRRRIRASAGYTYLNEIVAQSQDSSLHRWDDRLSRPVRVYFVPSTAANFQPEFVDAIRQAFQRWSDTGVPVRFDIVSDSERAEVLFRWKVQFDIDRTGQTDLAWDSAGRVLSGVVTIATFDPKGRALTSDDIRVVALHEIGHLMGLDHSSDSADIMFARTQARDLSSRDVRTALMLYQLAPGPLR